MTHLLIFSAIYLTVSGLSLTMGFNALRMNKQGTINRLFFALCLCMTLWALGFSVTIVAPDASSAALWTRVSAVGYSLLYSVLLHFTLSLTGQNRFLGHKWIYPLLYAPAAGCLYAFVISPSITSSLYQFVSTDSGWMRVISNTLYDTAFAVYFIGFVLLSLISLGLWQRRSTESATKKQGRLLIAAIVAAISLGIVTDVANGVYFDLPIPRMAPLLFLIPLAAISYCINRYHFMKPKSLHSSEMILSDEHRLAVFRVASIGLVSSGIILFALECFWWRLESPAIAVIISLLLIVMGTLLYYAQQKEKGVAYLELFLVAASLTVTPMLMINMTQYGGLAVWTFPIILIICSLVFNMRLMLFSTAAASVIGQIYLWGVAPEITAVVDFRTYYQPHRHTPFHHYRRVCRAPYLYGPVA